MEYKTENAIYEVFSANMTVDMQSDIYSTGNLAPCNCKCKCYACRSKAAGGIRLEGISKEEAENFLGKLLAA